MNVLLLYPSFPSTYWGMQYVLPILGKKASMPPLGLITIAAMCPSDFKFQLVDLNCEELKDEVLNWADVVFTSAMLQQKGSFFQINKRCQERGKKVVVGGPYPTSSPAECSAYSDAVVCGEAESIWPEFIDDLNHDRLKPRYSSDEKPDVTQTPVPRFDLLNMSYYLTIPIQYSRGCPFRCEFCDIIVMYGRYPRTKTPEQITRELEAVFQTGYRGDIFIVDDNFIGNIKEVKKLLPEVKKWNEAYKHPFTYGTEATVNLAHHDDLLKNMITSGFRFVFLGIETPSEASLKETLKFQNTRGSLEEIVNKILSAGLLISAGFIIGFDSDREDIFDRQIEFIRRTAIPFAMVGLLVALPGTPLYNRLKKEGRLEEDIFPNNESDQCGYTNINTKIPKKELLMGYRQVMQTLYSPKEYFERAYQTTLRLPRPKSLWQGLTILKGTFSAGLRYFFSMGTGPLYTLKRVWKNGLELIKLFWQMPGGFIWQCLRLAGRLLKSRPDQLGSVLEYAVFGIHFYKFTHDHVLPELDLRLKALPKRELNHTRA